MWRPVDEWREEARGDSPDTAEQRTRHVWWEFGMNRETLYLLGGSAMLLWSLGGGWLIHPRLLRRGGESPRGVRGERVTIPRPDGSQLRVEAYGPENGAHVIMTHGWTLNSEEWCYAKDELARAPGDRLGLAGSGRVDKAERSQLGAGENGARSGRGD